MKSRRRLIVFTLLFSVCIGNYSRIANHDAIRNVVFLSIFALGVVSALFLSEIIDAIKNR